MVHKVTSKDDLKAKLAEAGDKLVVVDFYATWCGPCKMIAPMLEGLAAEKPNLVILKIDVDELEDLAAEYEITAMPTFIFFQKSQQVEKFTGANFGKIQAIVEKFLG